MRCVMTVTHTLNSGLSQNQLINCIDILSARSDLFYRRLNLSDGK